MRDRLLKTAILHWKRGLPLPTDLEAKLIAQGIDTHTLQNRYER